MFIILLDYKKPLEMVDEHLATHRQYLQDCCEKNYFIVTGPQQPRVGGVLISQISDRAKIEDVLKDDPFYVHDLADYNIIEFTPVTCHSEFSTFLQQSQDLSN